MFTTVLFVILTITPNPSLDLLFETSRLVWDDANRMDAPRRRPGGQGVNVTRAARMLGGSSVALVLLGGRVGDELERALAGEGTPYERIDIEGETRVFVGAREAETGRSMLLNPRGPQISPAETEGVVQSITAVVRRLQPRWVAACGSIPPGLTSDLYARIGQAAHELGARFVPDCDGDALRTAARYADLLVPNRHEAERLLGLPIVDTMSAARAVRRLHELGAAVAAITLGAHGAVLSDRLTTWHVEPFSINRGSAVGAGDAFLAALLIELEAGSPSEIALRRAVAAGAAVLHSTGSDLLRNDMVQH
ncbi:MAG: 1-phosphofructokinase family hexose kinase, partial [Longimicrobiales bacterium]